MAVGVVALAVAAIAVVLGVLSTRRHKPLAEWPSYIVAIAALAVAIMALNRGQPAPSASASGPTSTSASTSTSTATSSSPTDTPTPTKSTPTGVQAGVTAGIYTMPLAQ